MHGVFLLVAFDRLMYKQFVNEREKERKRESTWLINIRSGLCNVILRELIQDLVYELFRPISFTGSFCLPLLFNDINLDFTHEIRKQKVILLEFIYISLMRSSYYPCNLGEYACYVFSTILILLSQVTNWYCRG